MGKYDALRAEAERIKRDLEALGRVQKKFRRTATEMRTHEVPVKKHTKGKKASPSWHLSSVRGVPGGAGKSGYSIMKMVQADYTGTRIRKESIGLIKSAQNSNTTDTRHDAKVRGLIT